MAETKINSIAERFAKSQLTIDVVLGVNRSGFPNPPNQYYLNYTYKQSLPQGEPVKIIVRYYLTNSTILTWETTYVNNTLYIEVPNGCLPDASKDAFVALLEYAEEVLLCEHAIVYFNKDREDRGKFLHTFKKYSVKLKLIIYNGGFLLFSAKLMRTFMFMGCFAAPADSPLVDVPDTSNVYMVYKI